MRFLTGNSLIVMLGGEVSRIAGFILEYSKLLRFILNTQVTGQMEVQPWKRETWPVKHSLTLHH